MNYLHFRSIAIMVGVLAMAFSISYIALAVWQEPTATPPGSNVPPPINVGGEAQEKKGALTVTTLTASGNLVLSSAFRSPNGADLVVDAGDGSVNTLTLYDNVSIPNGDLTVGGIKGCSGKVYADSNGLLKCGTDDVNDADADPSNELQKLSISGRRITLSKNGGFVDVPDDRYNPDNEPTATIRGEPTRDEIEKWGDRYDDVNDADADPKNEIQTLSIKGRTISLTQGGDITLPPDEVGIKDAYKDLLSKGKIGVERDKLMPGDTDEWYNSPSEVVEGFGCTGKSGDYYLGADKKCHIDNKGISGKSPITDNRIPKFTSGGTELTNSVIYESNGNVGIGTNPSASRLEIKSSGEFTTPLRIKSSSDRTLGGFMEHSDGRGIVLVADAAGSTKVKLDTGGYSYFMGGNVGIGTTDPVIDLAIGDSDTGLQQQGDGELGIYTNNTERLRIDKNGNIGIGMTGPLWGKLNVKGDTLMFGNSYIEGDVGIGVESPKAKLDVDGAIKVGKSTYTGTVKTEGFACVDTKSPAKLGNDTCDKDHRGMIKIREITCGANKRDSLCYCGLYDGTPKWICLISCPE